MHGEVITRRPIRRDIITFSPKALHVFAGNTLPNAPGATGAFWDRWEVLEFSRRFRDTDDAIPEIGQKIVENEFEHLVHAALRGAQRVLERGEYTQSTSGTEALARWRSNADPVGMFIEEWCSPIDLATPAAQWALAGELYSEYREWCEKRGENPHHTKRKFTRALRGAGYERKRSNGARYPLRVLSRQERQAKEAWSAWS